MRQISLRRDRDRTIVAFVVALTLHAVIFLLVPFLPGAQAPLLEAPMYVALDPYPPVEADELQPQPAPDPPPAPEPRTPPEPDPPIQEDPLPQDSLASGEPAPVAPAEPAAAPASSSSQQPASVPAQEPAPVPAGPTFVETPPPPPPPPRTSEFSSLRGEFAAVPDGRDDSFIEGQISSLYDWQATWQDQLSAWEERQAERSQPDMNDQQSSSSASSAQQDSLLSQQLDRLIAGIRASSDNVVEAPVPGVASSGVASDRGDENAPGDGSGIVVEDGGGTRVRVTGDAVTLDGISLGAGFPPEYPVSVRFSVDAAGRVFNAEVRPPSPEPELDAAILRAVRTWRFGPAGSADAPAARGTVTIIVQTR